MALQNVRKRIYQLAELEVLILLTVGVIKMTSGLVLTFGNLPIQLFSESFNLFNLIALLLLSGTIAIQYSTPENRLTGKEAGALLFFTAIIYRVLLRHGVPIKYGALGILAVAGIVGAWSLFVHSDMLHNAGKKSLYTVNLMCLISLGTAFIISYPLGGSLVMLFAGVYHLLANIENALFEHIPWIDPVEIIYRSIVNLSISSLGTLFAGLSLVSLFWTLYLGPSLVIAPVSIETYANLSKLPFSTNIFQIVFTIFLSIYWLYLLRRLPASVEHWQRSRFNWDIHTDLPPRPQLRHLVFFVFAWILSVAPQYISRAQGVFYGLHYNSTISKAYALLIISSILIAILSLLPATRSRIWFKFVSHPASVKGDYQVFKYSIGVVFAGIIYGAFFLHGSPHDLMYLLSCTIAAATEVIDWVPSYIWPVFPLVVILLPFLTTSMSVYWDLLFFHSIGYMSTKCFKYL